jgi:tetratricopeptide (TPR) repeat protein
MAAGSWKSAWLALEAADPANADPYVLAQKFEVCVQGYVQSDGFRAFSFVDLQPGQSLAALRAGPGDYELIEFDPIAAAVAFSESGASLPPVLYAAIGDYYYEVQNLFPEQWFISDEEVCSRGLSCYEEAIAAGVANASIYRREGELLIRFGRSPDAETRLRAALALDRSDADAHFALAVAVAQQNRVDEAFGEVDAAAAAYKDADRRFSAYMLGARIASGADAARSEAYLAAAEKEFPSEPSPALLRHSLAIQSGDAEAAEKMADAAFGKFPESPYVVRTILTNWIQAGDVMSAVSFLDRGLERLPAKEVSLGILGFYKALLTMEVSGPDGYAEAGKILDEAEANFRKAYPEDNEVFGAIAELRGRLTAPPEGGDGTEGGEAPSGTTD